MARLSRATGPTANFELTAVLSDIPQLTERRDFGSGPILIIGTIFIRNATAGLIGFLLQIAVDGATLPVPANSYDITAGRDGYLTLIHLLPPQPGHHTITLQARGGAAVGDIALAGACFFTVYEIPLVDNPARIA